MRTKQFVFLLVLTQLLFLTGVVKAEEVEQTPTEESLSENEQAQQDPAPPKPSDLTLKKLPVQIGKGFVGIFSGRNLRPLLIGSAATGGAVLVDDEIHNKFKNENDEAVSQTANQLGRPYVLAPVLGALFITGLNSENERFRSFSYSLVTGYVVDVAMYSSIKAVSNRERPDGSNRNAFPSGHATDSFMIATVLHKHYGRKAGIIGYSVASVIAGTRLKRDVHWFSDVVAGATLGYIIGSTVSAQTQSGEPSRMALMPRFDFVRKSYAVELAIRLD